MEGEVGVESSIESAELIKFEISLITWLYMVLTVKLVNFVNDYCPMAASSVLLFFDVCYNLIQSWFSSFIPNFT